ncbi:DUF6326 family protein [Robertkochia sediminum]|uniref:DUF6326 family protein n=1 Tax=Robertkochia sediminum TaxID=2785326 RepID=UPI001933177C|nr:DUF6326 family protein [Robertkochia sediminum]MBL7472025.1 hypothetical protein [Robertkochia sediminum]
MTSQKDDRSSLTDTPVSTKLKLASLWTALMFLYIYADYFRLMTPGKLEKMMELKTPMGPTTPELLIIFSSILIVPALMIFLSVFLKPLFNKWLNITIALLYAAISILIIVSGMGDAWQTFFVLFNGIELLVLGIILYQAWTWPRN